MMHRACGVDSEVANYPYIYFLYPLSPTSLWRTTCVEACPIVTEAQAESNSPPALKCAVEPSEGLKDCN